MAYVFLLKNWRRWRNENHRGHRKRIIGAASRISGCRTNSRIKGAIYVRNPMSPSKREISYYDALFIFGMIIREAEKLIEEEVSE